MFLLAPVLEPLLPLELLFVQWLSLLLFCASPVPVAVCTKHVENHALWWPPLPPQQWFTLPIPNNQQCHPATQQLHIKATSPWLSSPSRECRWLRTLRSTLPLTPCSRRDPQLTMKLWQLVLEPLTPPSPLTTLLTWILRSPRIEKLFYCASAYKTFQNIICSVYTMHLYYIFLEDNNLLFK